MRVLLVVGMGVLAGVGGEAAAVVHGVEVGAVLDHHVLVDVVEDPPVLFLNQVGRD